MTLLDLLDMNNVAGEIKPECGHCWEKDVSASARACVGVSVAALIKIFQILQCFDKYLNVTSSPGLGRLRDGREFGKSGRTLPATEFLCLLFIFLGGFTQLPSEKDD